MTDKQKEKKHNQLGMNPSTAQGRLVKDILWSLVVKTKQNHCCKCGKEMTRATFSIEHVIPWLDSENPLQLFFDLDNIAFSHLSCNIADVRRPRLHATKELAKEKERELHKMRQRNSYCPIKRKKRYLEKGS